MKVVDLGFGMSAALIARFLRHCGMSVTRFEPATGDPFYRIYDAYVAWHRGMTVIAVDDPHDEAVRAALEDADILIVGGEDHPDVSWKIDPLDLARQYPRLVIVDLADYPRNGPFQPRPAVELLVQARSGLVNEQYSDRPMGYAFPAATYGSAMQALVALFAALFERDRSGLGQIVSSSMLEGALMWCIWDWSLAERPDRAFASNAPKNPRPTIFRCADGTYIHIVIGSRGSKGGLYRILGIDDPNVGAEDSGMPGPDAPPEKYFGDIDTIAPYVARWRSDDLLRACAEARIAAAPVLAPGVCWADPQVATNGIIVTADDGSRHVGHPIRTRWFEIAGEVADTTPKVTSGKGPLAGVRVLELGGFVAGPYAALLLADLGAEVIKIEPLAGEPNRKIPPVFMSNNRGKRSLAIDLKSADGVAILHRAARQSDIVLNNLGPGVAARLGVNAATLHDINPRLVTLDITAFGLEGPKADRPGFDMIMQAIAGHEVRGAGPGGPPFWTRSSMVDYTTGLLGAAGILAALIQSRRDNRGAAVDVSLLDAGIFLLSELVQSSDGEFKGARGANRDQTGVSPCCRLYRTQDGWIALTIFSERDAQRLHDALRLDAPFMGPPSTWGESEERRIEGAFIGLTTEQITGRLADAGVWHEPVNQQGKIGFLRDDRWFAAGKVLSHHDARYGEVRQLGSMMSFSRTAISPRGAYPALGADSEQILHELGYDTARIVELAKLGVIGVAHGGPT